MNHGLQNVEIKPPPIPRIGGGVVWDLLWLHLSRCKSWLHRSLGPVQNGFFGPTILEIGGGQFSKIKPNQACSVEIIQNNSILKKNLEPVCRNFSTGDRCFDSMQSIPIFQILQQLYKFLEPKVQSGHLKFKFMKKLTYKIKI